MLSPNQLNNGLCPHVDTQPQKGLALVTFGNSHSGDDGIAPAVCDLLPKSTLSSVCRFDLGTHTGYLCQCLGGHKAAIIVDLTNKGSAPGTVSIMDLSMLLERASPINIGSCHGLSLADELRQAYKSGRLPKRLIFLGIETDHADRDTQLSLALKAKFPELAMRLSLLVTTMVETLKRNA